MSSYVGTTRGYSMNMASRKKGYASLSRIGQNVVKTIIILIGVLFVVVSLSAYTATLQYENNTLKSDNAYLQAEIDSMNNQIVEETKITRIEKLATEKYDMVYPTSDNCITINQGEPMADSLAATIKSEAYN